MADLNKNTIIIKFDEDEVNKIITPIQTEAERLINKLDKVLAIQSEILCSQPIDKIALDVTKVSDKFVDKLLRTSVISSEKKDSINIIDEIKEFLKYRHKYCMKREGLDSRYKDEAHGYLMALQRINELETLYNKSNK
ncbi:hypothetical protein AB4G91_01475 [Macrococcoides goetzii]|uniref:hypothetical protein n=1 Tax=Macrococcus sp. PK TaxID=2801919 RepID=UPI001F0D4C57|nr:hypothetical protein [Macrococcus sp. PK]MCH4983967.1 hypothetical protein [Macrococcus sp. PK]